MAAEITQVTVRSGDITQITVSNSDTSSLSVQSGDTTIISSASATINLANLSLSDSDPQDIAREASSGILTTVSRSDHQHSIANTLLDGGNY